MHSLEMIVKRNEAAVEKAYDVVGQIMAYEQGELAGDDAFLALFQHLIDSGLVWQLQGSYGRTAAALIESGDCVDTRKDIR